MCDRRKSEVRNTIRENERKFNRERIHTTEAERKKILKERKLRIGTTKTLYA